ncbi:MAG: hypothetical protein ACRDHU_07790 [Actinomycetota bacterium]
MRKFVRSLSVVSVLFVAAAIPSPAIAERAPGDGPDSRVAAPAVVHGRVAAGSTDYPTSFEVFARRGRPAVGAASTVARAGGPRAPQATLGFDALSDPFAFPADTTGALGDTYFVTAVNTQLAVYDRTGAVVVAPMQLDVLHPDSAGRFAFDPKVVYDQYNDTFVLAYLVQEDAPKLSRIIVVAIPNTTAATTSTWCATSFPGDALPASPNVWADYPGLGYNLDRVTITTNQFTFPSSAGRFRYAQVMSIPKTSLYDCTTPPPVPDVFAGTQTEDPDGIQSTTLQPAQTVDLPAASQLLTSVQLAGKKSYLVLWRIKSTSSGLKLKKGALPIGKTFAPPFGTQGGGALDDIDTFWDAGDERLVNAFYDADANQLFTAHAVFKDLTPDTVTGAYPESAVRWYEVNPAGKLKNSSLARKGTIGAPEVDTGWPTVATDGSGNLFVTYNRGSAVTGEFLSAWVAEILPGGTAATQVLLKAGLATYEANPGGPERWGDFTGINRDPVNPAVVATFNQYALDLDSWQQFVNLVQHV